jgi:hypothetical protein
VADGAGSGDAVGAAVFVAVGVVPSCVAERVAVTVAASSVVVAVAVAGGVSVAAGGVAVSVGVADALGNGVVVDVDVDVATAVLVRDAVGEEDGATVQVAVLVGSTVVEGEGVETAWFRGMDAGPA